MKLLLLRHARTLAADGLCYGRLDVPVHPALTREAAERVAAGLPASLALRHSPLVRCHDLALALAALRPELQPTAEPRIAEMDFGDWEDRPWSSIARAEFEAWMAAFADRPAGGSGESTRAFMQRVGGAFDDWRAGGRDALWVTHAGVIRAVELLHTGQRCVERGDQWPSRPIAFGELLTVEV
jgi:alpha-ribazole phosphatase